MESIFECSNKDVAHDIHCQKLAALREETSPPLTFSFTSFKIKINPLKLGK